MDLCQQAAYSIGSIADTNEEWLLQSAEVHGAHIVAAIVCFLDSAKISQFLSQSSGGDWTAWTAMMTSFVA